MAIDLKEQRAIFAEMLKRNQDYSEQEFREQRERLVKNWRAAHPECADEPPSAKHRPLVCADPGDPKNPQEHPEVWDSDLYQVTVRRWPKDPVFKSDGGIIQIGINALDGTARHDWREMQWIKNQIAGEECEGFELFPAESRLLDPSNYYTIWCFPGLKNIHVGVMMKRRVYDSDEAMAPQRGFEK